MTDKELNDKELLELAAKAAGIELQWESDGTVQNRMTRPTIPYSCQGLLSAIEWNPLADDGDALRLAVKLGQVVDVQPSKQRTVVTTYEESRFFIEKHNNNPYAATRRAIVRACAAIGENL